MNAAPSWCMARRAARFEPLSIREIPKITERPGSEAGVATLGRVLAAT